MWGCSDRERAICILLNYYNPHLIRKFLLAVSIIAPLFIIYKWTVPLTEALAIGWYTMVYEFFIRRIIICKRF